MYCTSMHNLKSKNMRSMEVMSLPMSPELSSEEHVRIVQMIVGVDS